MTALPPDDLPRELLAAYADGELDGPSRDRVEHWLADHPDGLGEVQAQRALSPANAGLWERALPPDPSEGAWALARNEIVRRLASSSSTPATPERPARRWRGAWALAGLAAAGVAAAAAVWLALGPGLPSKTNNDPDTRDEAGASNVAPHPRMVILAPAPHSTDAIDGFAILPIATDDDVVLERVPEFPAGWLPIGRHPLEGTMALATVEELMLAEVEPSAMWPTGSPKMTTSPSDAPMIYAAKLR
jgi:hypothetical protein